MADPKIRYDVEANATGAADVNRLAVELEKLDKSIDPAAAARAEELAQKLRLLGQQEAALQAFVQLKQRTEEARTALDQAQTAAQALGRQLATVETPTRAQAGQMQKLGDAVKAAKLELQTQTAALDGARGSLNRLGLETEGLAKSQIRVRQELGLTAVEAGVVAQRYQATAAAAQDSGRKQAAAQQQVGTSLGDITRQLQTIQNLASVVIGGGLLGGLLKQAADTADAYSNLGARIKLVTGEGQGFAQAFEGVFDVAKRTNSSLESTGQLFTRVAEAGKAIGVTQRDALALTETINQAVQLSGSSAQASDAALNQFIQSLQSGVFRGEEFNAVAEQSPRLLKAIADGLGVTTGELRKLAEAGELEAGRVLGAIRGQSGVIKSEFETLPVTVGRALQNLSTEWTRYVGEVDQANGISATAAQAIGFLASNLSELAGAAKFAGEAWLAYKALDLAGSLFRQQVAVQGAVLAVQAQTVAVVADTAAKQANTAATVANTAATAAGAAASRTAAAAAVEGAGALATLGRFAGLLGLVTTAALLFGDTILSVFRIAGTAIGKGDAKLAGFKDRSAEVEAQQRAQEAAVRANNTALAELAQKAQIASERSLGLNEQSRALVGTFNEAQKKGEGVAESLDKVAKGLKLGDISGVNAAVTALDVLGQRGKITGDQITESLGKALKSLDLGTFEANARAAFDSSEQGVRRLGQALDALREEALLRAGTGVRELATGFNATSVSALNDLDALSKALVDLKAPADAAGRALSTSVSKATEAATTEKAVEAVIQRIEELGRAGKLTGEQLATALDGARKKLDDLKPGISSLEEALRTLGLKTRRELQDTADQLGQAYAKVAASGQVSLQQQIEAYAKWRDAAIAANGGVEAESVKLQGQILKSRAEVLGLGEDFGKAMDAAGKAVGKVSEQLKELEKQKERTAGGSLVTGSSGLGGFPDASGAPGVRQPSGVDNQLAPARSGVAPGSLGDLIRNTPSGGITRSYLLPSITPQAIGGVAPNFGGLGPGAGLVRTPPQSSAPAPAPAQPPVYMQTVNIGGKSFDLAFSNQSSAAAAVAAFEAAYRAGATGR